MSPQKLIFDFEVYPNVWGVGLLNVDTHDFFSFTANDSNGSNAKQPLADAVADHLLIGFNNRNYFAGLSTGNRTRHEFGDN